VGDPSLRHALGFIDASMPSVPSAVPAADAVATPGNLDPADFRKLRSRILSTALAFADLDGKVCNNTSVVLLLEWQGKRLLFVGDAEWDAGFKKGTKGNCSWNVMWNLRKPALGGALAFYKIGHHGSVNATPWGAGKATEGEPLDILNAILPVGSQVRPKAVVSTRRGNYPTIPDTGLLAEIGNRVSDTKNYATAFQQANLQTSDVPHFAEYEAKAFAKAQPLRTDLEHMLGSQGFLDVEIDP
jgi:hypothetical protein